MRRSSTLVLALLVAAAVPAAAQNTDIESLSGLQFNFGNPGARSLGMGGAFLGLADDASAAEANPAGLTILRKPEVSLETRNYLEQQVLSTSGSFPQVDRTTFSHYSQRASISFGSFVYPVKDFTFGVYYHEPLRNQGAGQVVPVRNEFTGAVKTDVPNFYLPKGGTPVSKAQCESIRNDKKDFFACLEYTVLPFITSVDVQERTFGFAGAWKRGNFSIGASGRYQRFRESSFTFRVTPTFDFSSISVQSTAKLNKGELEIQDEHDITFSGGVKWAPNDRFSVGGVYKKGPKFVAPTFAANAETKFEYQKVGDTTFHVPDIYGVGFTFRPVEVLTINADAVRVKYSNLVDNFQSINESIRGIDKAYRANDVVELHLGGEYVFSTKIGFALRAGAWRDPAHAVEFRGPLTSPDAVAAAILYPKGEAATHVAVGGGFAWPKFQIDFAYDTSPHYKVGSLSAVTRF